MSFFNEEQKQVALRVGLNIIAPKSAELLSEELKEAALGGVAVIRVQITDASDPSKILVDEEIPACKFASGNVGYKLHVSGLAFQS